MQNGEEDCTHLVNWISVKGEKPGFSDDEALAYERPKNVNSDCEYPYPWMIRRLLKTYVPEIETSTSEQKQQYLKWN